MESPFAPNSSTAESQAHHEKPPENLNFEPPSASQPNQDTDSGNPYTQHYQPTAAIWALYLKETEAEDKEFAQLWQIGLDQLLIFAGLFGAILTAFLIESRKGLKEDPLGEILQALRNDSVTSTSEPFRPTKSSLAVNAAWFSSLCLTLISALAAVLAKGWLAKYTPATPGVRSSDACERHLRYLRARQWRLGMIVAGIPLLIQIALFLFAVGLVIFTLNDDFGIGIIVLVLAILATALYFLCTILPWFSPASPFQTTMSELIPGLAMKARYVDCTSGKKGSPTLPTPLSLRERVSLQWKGLTKFLREAHRKPERVEIEADILVWMLTSTTSEEAVEEAVKAVAGATPSIQLRDALSTCSASEILCHVERVEGYLYAMLRIVEPSSKGNQDKFPFMHELLQIGQPLHRWDDVVDYLQPLAYAVQTRILLATGKDGHTDHWERTEASLIKMASMGLAPAVRRVLVSATVEGLLAGEIQLRKSCAIVLCKQLQIPAARRMVAKKDLVDVTITIAKLLKGCDEVVSEILLEGIIKFAEYVKCRESAIAQIVTLLGDKNRGGWRAGADALSKLSEQAGFRESIRPAIPQVVALLDHSAGFVRTAGANALSKLSNQTEFRESIRPAIPQVVALLDHSNQDVRRAGANALSKLSEQAEFREFIQPAIPRLVALLNDGHWLVCRAGAKALSKLAKQAEFRPSIRPAIPLVVALLDHSNQDVRQAGADALSKLSEQAEFRESIQPAIPQVVALLSDNNMFVHEPAANALSRLSEQAECREFILSAIPEVVALLDHSNGWVRHAGADALSKFADQAEFRDLIGAAIPRVVALLNDRDWYVRTAGANSLSKLAEQAEFRASIQLAIPQVVALLDHSNEVVRREVANSLSKLSQQAEFRASIQPAIPQVVALLSDNNWYVRTEGANILSELSEQAEFRESIRLAIPQVVALLNDSNKFVRRAGADALSKLSEQAEFRDGIQKTMLVISWPTHPVSKSPQQVPPGMFNIADLVSRWSSNNRFQCAQDVCLLSKLAHFAQICDAQIFLSLLQKGQVLSIVGIVYKLTHYKRAVRVSMPQIVALLDHSDGLARTAGANALVKLSEQAEFREPIGSAIPQIIALLSDGDGSVRRAGTNALLKLSEQAGFRASIQPAIPQIAELLSDDNCYEVRTEGANALSKLSEQAEFRDSIQLAIPLVIALLSDRNWFICQAGADALSKLAEQAELRESIQEAIPQVVALLDHINESIRAAGAYALSKLSQQAEFRQSIRPAIPQVFTLLNHGIWFFRTKGADALSKLSEQAEFRESIQPFIPQVVALLTNSIGLARRVGAYTLWKLSGQAEFRASIQPAIPQIVAHLSDSNLRVRADGANTLSKLSEQAEFRDSIQLAIPLVVALLSDSDWFVCRAGADALSKLAEQAEFRASIQPVIPQVIALLSHSDGFIREVGAGALSKLSEQAEFRKSIRPGIPQLVALFNQFDDLAGADALSKLSEQAEFRAPIQQAIPQIVDFLRHNSSPVRQSAACLLEKLSSQGAICWILNLNTPDSLCDLSSVDYCPSIASHIQYFFPVLLEDPDIHTACTSIFAHLVVHGHLREMIVKILTFSLHSLYSDDPNLHARGVSIIEVLAKYAPLQPILHEIWAIYSFGQDFLSDISLEQIKFFVEQMELYGILKTL